MERFRSGISYKAPVKGFPSLGYRHHCYVLIQILNRKQATFQSQRSKGTWLLDYIAHFGRHRHKLFHFQPCASSFKPQQGRVLPRRTHLWRRHCCEHSLEGCSAHTTTTNPGCKACAALRLKPSLQLRPLAVCAALKQQCQTLRTNFLLSSKRFERRSSRSFFLVGWKTTLSFHFDP